MEKEFGEKSRKSGNRNKNPLIPNTSVLEDDQDSVSVASSTSINSAIRKYLRQELPDEALNEIGKENPFNKSNSPNRKIKKLDTNQKNLAPEDTSTPAFIEDDRSQS